MTLQQTLNNLYAILCFYANKCGVAATHTKDTGDFLYNAFDLKEEIEKALKEHEQLKIDYEELNDIHDELVKYKNKERDDVVKKLKALEIIKEKRVNVYQMLCIFKEGLTYEDYEKLWNIDIERYYKHNTDLLYSHFKLTQEEYDLLKEVLL
jgi:hypothetical protein